MSDKTGIEWTDATWNPVVGCSRVSAGCKNCYAFRAHDMRHAAYMRGAKLPDQYAHPFTTIQTVLPRASLPLMWKKPRRIFVNSTSDLFHEDVPLAFIALVMETIRACPRHTFQVLTKRPRRALEWVQWVQSYDLSEDPEPALPPNLWLGVSVENQAAAEERIPILLDIPVSVRFLSCEPLLGPLNLRKIVPPDDELNIGYDALAGALCGNKEPGGPGIHWVIAGGESGPGARPMHPDWARNLRDQCQAAGVPFFFKQWGEWAPVEMGAPMREHQPVVKFTPGTFENAFPIVKLGKTAAGRLLDGREWNEYPKPAPAGSRITQGGEPCPKS